MQAEGKMVEMSQLHCATGMSEDYAQKDRSSAWGVLLSGSDQGNKCADN